ncbi:phage portal protein [Tundrisphaera lichenicola]|uniref:phage portal protein n=1 Tax=Tundrisphaera lichenicola TaxID=2029860 RepID=UPI003EBA47BF
MSLTGDDHTQAYEFLRDLEEGVLERAAPSGVGQGSIGYGAGGPVWLDNARSRRPPTPPELVEAYKSVAYACIGINANAVARVPLRLYVKTGRDQARPRFWETRRIEGFERKVLQRRIESSPVTRSMAHRGEEIDEVLSHPLLDVLDSPNPHFDGNQLIQFLAITLDAIGTAYWYPEKLGDDFAPSEIWPLQSQYCYPEKGTNPGEIIKQYRYFSDTFAFPELVRFRGLSLRDPYLSGLAPLHACYEQLGLVGDYTGVVQSMLKAGARPDAIIGPKDGSQPWNEDARKRMETKVNSGFGRGNQGRIWAVDGSFDYHALTHPPADLAGLEISKDARLIAANCFGVPISMMEASDSNRAVAAEGASQHQLNAVSPRCCLIGSGLTHQLARRVDPRLFFLFDDPVERNRLNDAKIHQVYLGGRVVTRNEVRAEIGYEPLEGLDEFEQPQAPGKAGRAEDDDPKKGGD